jgi:2-polyprenyl-3-methyl-5-hydroxy-6-metoxy-1,4-benzoquinol methylase
MNAGQLDDTRAAFDSVAAEYDGSLGNNELVQRLRVRTLAALTRSVPPGAELLDLGCGTGLDAVFLARQGYRVTAIDWSAQMLRRTQERAKQAGVDGGLAIHHLGIHELERLPPGEFDAAYSDLGSLNCVPDLAGCARSIAARVRPGGVLVASVIGRVCVWELALFAAKRQWRRARLRAARTSVSVPLNGRTVWTAYYSPSEFRSAFERAGFRLRSLRALALLSPPPYMFAFSQRHPGLVATLQTLEDRVAAWPGLRQWGDHFLIVMQRDA